MGRCPTPLPEPRPSMKILSVTSHVCFGHVGAQASVLPLQRLGHDVCLVPTVLLSNHPGYGGMCGGPLFS